MKKFIFQVIFLHRVKPAQTFFFFFNSFAKHCEGNSSEPYILILCYVMILYGCSQIKRVSLMNIKLGLRKRNNKVMSIFSSKSCRKETILQTFTLSFNRVNTFCCRVQGHFMVQGKHMPP